MSEINVKRFVDVNIISSASSAISGTRDTAVLFTPDGTASTVKTINSLSEALSTYSEADAPTTRAYLTVFFNNGGVKCRVIEGKAYSSVTAADIAGLDNDYITVILAAPDANVEAAYSAAKTLAQTRNADTTIYGVNEKIIIARTEVYSDATSVKNFAVKYSNVLGGEMTIAAYLSRINVYRANSIFDYAFTEESIDSEILTDTNFGTVIINNMNVDIDLANSVRNCGGNLKDGNELTNEYTRIVLHQTLTSKLLSLLTKKIKNNSGISQIYTTIAQELEQYKTAGYLTTDKIWTNEDLIVSYNNKNYTVITQGTPIVSGYVIKVLPLSSLTDADKLAHSAPPIHIVIADQYGIRKITIDGEVF